MQSEQEVRDIKKRHSAALLGKRGVSGVGVEKDDAGRYVLAIHLGTNDPSVSTSLPTQIEGCPVKLVYSGPFRKL
jgi:hypothetical protein